MNDLDQRLLRAHGLGDKTALVKLYSEAADRAADPDAAGFYLTHAYVYALEINHPATGDLRARLVADGREE